MRTAPVGSVVDVAPMTTMWVSSRIWPATAPYADPTRNAFRSEAVQVDCCCEWIRTSPPRRKRAPVVEQSGRECEASKAFVETDGHVHRRDHVDTFVSDQLLPGSGFDRESHPFAERPHPGDTRIQAIADRRVRPDQLTVFPDTE